MGQIDKSTLIDKCVLIEELQKDMIMPSSLYEMGINAGIEKVMKRVTNAYTIKTEPVRHGRWEWKCGIPYCSNCGEMLNGYSYDGDINTTLYCSNCGAKMDG